MTLKTTITDTISTFLRHKIQDNTIVGDLDNFIDDAVSVQASSQDRVYYKLSGDSSLHKLIHNRLGHITVNPHKTENTNALTSTYVTNAPSGKHSTIVNHSPDSIYAFVEELISIAEEEKNIDHRSEATVTVLHGPKGCGKTFFLNHLLAKYSDTFDRRKVLWIRVNLTANFGSNDLRHWIYAQCTKVILRYYDPASEYYNNDKDKTPPIPLRKILEDFIIQTQSNEKVRDRQLVQVQKMCQIYQKEDRDQNISAALIPSVLALESFYAALHHGYRLIIALDGLDLLEATSYHRKKFSELHKQALELSTGFEPFKAAIILVTRTNTLEKVTEDGESNPFTRMIDEYKQVMPIDYPRIIEARKRYILQNLESFTRDENANLKEYKDHFEQFFKFLEEKETRQNRRETLVTFGDNLRAQMQTTQLAYFDYTYGGKYQKYQIIESLVKAGRFFPPRHYQYEIDRDIANRKVGNNTLFDTHLFPTLFSFPCLDFNLIAQQRIKYPNAMGMLLPLRILQILRAHDYRLRQERNMTERLKVFEIIEICNGLFKYPKSLVKLVIEELEQFELVYLGSKEFPAPTLIEAMEIHSTSKSNNLLGNVLYEIAYLNLASMRVPLKSSHLTKIPPYFKAHSINILDMPPPEGPKTPEERRIVLITWISAKITNSIGLCRVLSYLNERQKEEANKNISKLRPRLATTIRIAQQSPNENEPGLFGFPGFMINQLEKEIRAIINNISEYELQQLKNKIDTYIRAWS